MSFSTDLENQLINHEDLRLKPYLDCCGRYWWDCTCKVKGKLTIGVGRNLDDNGITREEAMALLRDDIAEALVICEKLFPGFQDLSDRRQRALIDMAFNLGETRLRQFVRLRAAIVRDDFEGAADSMRNSLWHTQVGKRAVTLETMMREG